MSGAVLTLVSILLIILVIFVLIMIIATRQEDEKEANEWKVLSSDPNFVDFNHKPSKRKKVRVPY